jgi:predicted carbohydrate-binding protein with CBM5 and CBM33 domain
MNLGMGMKVKTKKEKLSYYQEVIIPKGSIGEIGAIHVPVVRNTKGHMYFNCVDFNINGKRISGSYYNNEIEIEQV